MKHTARAPKPYVTWGLCIALIIVWVAELFIPGVIQHFAFMPLLGLFEPWRFITAAFLHSVPTPFHLAFNTWALLVVGRALEPVIGHMKLALAFAISAFGALMAQCLTVFIDPHAWITPTVGASGAVFGFFGMVLAIQKVLRLPWTEMGTLIGLNFVIGFLVPNVAWVAHLGGLLVGLVLGAYTGWVLRHATYVTIPVEGGDVYGFIANAPEFSKRPDSGVSDTSDALHAPDTPGTANEPENTDATEVSNHSDAEVPDGSDTPAAAPTPILRRVTSTRTRLRDFAVYGGVFVVLVASNWTFYHFNYEAIYSFLK
ncbi:rhomboid family intramembrane serine protease [Mobiluncus curtisii]|uniref:Peptidase, S54 family n=2 Tax=Mobiluncus curtisii TaxID=2051 RepID=D6ZJT3_MOBCV|nr:rhomboid family intramembrane serine protease [Mobiluncus curtisii]ADI66982.1 peptidase, S54 family [Mobiluncus curtisii ATCC 43063]EFL93512.1 peptidase, S54 family [Mobiluncus curtisii subsp. curtisii ATCC 35241]MCU9987332.1 rhomboid family intramembrane serine protease [Mobiluncus curtisii]MCV0001111.1 rhomboid family intramembrane serine protease [Mobiluncus curtisii]NMW49919.1 rhomboid family intramembrane serine protease [Mobiluncus curtisii]